MSGHNHDPHANPHAGPHGRDTRHTHPPEERLDAWHTHSAEEGAPQEEHAAKANPVLLFGVFIATVAGVVGMVLAVILYFGAYKTDLRERYVENLAMADKANAAKAAATAELAGPYTWIGPQQENIRIPITQAMERVIERYADSPSQPR